MEEEQSDRADRDFYVAKCIMLCFENIAIFYYPDLLERQYDYLYLATGIRWRIEAYMRSLAVDSTLLSELKRIRDICDDFQNDIYYHSHPYGYSGVTGKKIEDQKLRELVTVFRRQMSKPITRIVEEHHIWVDGFFKELMLDGIGL